MPSKQTTFFLSAILIIVGMVLTLENFLIIKGLSNHWPVFLLITGSGFIMLFLQRKKNDLFLLWLGSFISILGIFFYYLNFTTWGVLSILWPVFLGIIGISFLSVWYFSRLSLYAYFAISFTALFLALSLVFSVSSKLWPMTLVIVGLSLLILDHFTKKERMPNATKE
jgi:hypothetical protein